mgnify:CR=1 FL=1
MDIQDIQVMIMAHENKKASREGREMVGDWPYHSLVASVGDLSRLVFMERREELRKGKELYKEKVDSLADILYSVLEVGAVNGITGELLSTIVESRIKGE